MYVCVLLRSKVKQKVDLSLSPAFGGVLRFRCKVQSSAIDLLLKQLGRTTQTPLMTNRTHTLTVILCSVELRDTAMLFFSAQQGGQIAHRSSELFKREVDFLVAQHDFVFSFLSKEGNVFCCFFF